MVLYVKTWKGLRYAIILNQFRDSKNFITINIFASSVNESLRSNRTQSNTKTNKHIKQNKLTLLNHLKYA